MTPLQGFLANMDNLGPFQSGFMPGLGGQKGSWLRTFGGVHVGSGVGSLLYQFYPVLSSDCGERLLRSAFEISHSHR